MRRRSRRIAHGQIGIITECELSSARLTGRQITSPEGRSMADPGYPTTRHDYKTDAEEYERLEAAMNASPRGAIAVSAIAVALLLVGWLWLYFFIFLPRGTVG